MENICRFVPPKTQPDDLRTVNFVYETTSPDCGRLTFRATHMLALVSGGSGLLHLTGGVLPLQKGDLFLTFPGVPYRIEQREGLTYYYISFLGIRGVRILEELKLRHDAPVLHGYGFLEEFWAHALSIATAHNLELLSEGVLLNTFAEISLRTERAEACAHPVDNAARMQKYIDEHFNDPSLTLESVCRAFSYNPKYGSALLRRQLHVGFREYVRMLRIQYACALMGEGFSCVKDIAALCGYTDQAYFSRSFRESMGCSPTEWDGQQKKAAAK